jgi:hypothetical protein
MKQFAPVTAAPYRVMLPAVDRRILHNQRILREIRGLGAQSTAGEIQSGAAAVVTGVTGELAAVSAGTSTIIPLIGPALAVIAIAVEAIMNSGCGETCIETSQWANQAEPLLLANINAYFQLPTPRASSAQAYALSVFDQIWAGLVSRCSQQGLGTAGQDCISDRQAGACKWQQSTTSPLLAYTQYGEPAPGACWNWFSGYRDPIANDPDVVSDEEANAPAQVAGAITTVTGSNSNTTILLIAAAAAVAVLALGGSN